MQAILLNNVIIYSCLHTFSKKFAVHNKISLDDDESPPIKTTASVFHKKNIYLQTIILRVFALDIISYITQLPTNTLQQMTGSLRVSS